MEKNLEIGVRAFFLKFLWMYCPKFNVWVVPKNTKKSKKARNAKNAPEVLLEDGLSRRFPGGSAMSEA